MKPKDDGIITVGYYDDLPDPASQEIGQQAVVIMGERKGFYETKYEDSKIKKWLSQRKMSKSSGDQTTS